MSKRELEDNTGRDLVPPKLSRSKEDLSDEDIFNTSGTSLENLILSNSSIGSDKTATCSGDWLRGFEYIKCDGQGDEFEDNSGRSQTDGKKEDMVAKLLADNSLFQFSTTSYDPSLNEQNEGVTLGSYESDSNLDVTALQELGHLVSQDISLNAEQVSDSSECRVTQHFESILSPDTSSAVHGDAIGSQNSRFYPECPSWAYQLIGEEFFEAGQVQSCLSDFQSILESLADDLLDQAALMILDNKRFHRKIIERLGDAVSMDMKKALPESKLMEDNKQREYLLGVSPLQLCREFQASQKTSFEVVCRVLLGVKKSESIFENQKLLNTVCSIFSLIARQRNKHAIG